MTSVTIFGTGNMSQGISSVLGAGGASVQYIGSQDQGASVDGDNKTTVLIAGDDVDAKERLAAAVRAGGLESVDAGPLARARELEALGFLQLPLAASEKIQWTDGFALVR